MRLIFKAYFATEELEFDLAASRGTRANGCI